MAVATVPVVWLVQYSGGTEPGDRRLSADDAGELVRAAEIVAATDADHLDVVAVAGRRLPYRLGAFARGDRRTVDLVRSLGRW